MAQPNTPHLTPPDNALLDTQVRVPIDEKASLEEELDGATRVPSTISGAVTDPEKLGDQKVKLVTFEEGSGENPREWSNAKRWFVTLVVSALCFTVALGSALPTGDLGGPMIEFGVKSITINSSITLFVVGFGLGPLFFAPLSEEIGRKPIYIISMFLFFIFTLPCALAKNIETLLVCRLLAGIAASCPMTNVGGSVADLWAVEERGIAMAIFSATIFMGPCMGPLIGGFIGMEVGWRNIYWTLFAWVGLICILVALTPETLGRIILARKAQRLRKETGDPSYMSQEELNKTPMSEKMKVALVRPLVMLFTEPLLLCMTMYLSLIYALLYLFFFALPLVEMQHGFNLGEIGLCFISIMIGIFIALGGMPMQEKIYHRLTEKNGYRPEHRLTLMMFGAVLLPIGLFIFAWCSLPQVHWVAPLFGALIFGISMVTVYIGANSYIIDSYPEATASAVAAKTFLRSLVGAAVPLFVEPMYFNLHYQWAGTLLAFLAVAALPIPFVFYKFGPRIRAASRRAT